MSKDYKKLYESLKKEYKRLEQENKDLVNKLIFYKNEAKVNKELKENTDRIMFDKLTELNLENQKLSFAYSEMKRRLKKYEEVD